MLNQSPLITDLMIRLEQEYGQFDADEWPRFLRLLGLTNERANLPRKVPAMICDETVVISTSVTDASDVAWYAWHESGHWLLHEGDRDDWIDLPEGRAIIRKYERQVNEFAARYPRWSHVPNAARDMAGMFVVIVGESDYL